MVSTGASQNCEPEQLCHRSQLRVLGVDRELVPHLDRCSVEDCPALEVAKPRNVPDAAEPRSAVGVGLRIEPVGEPASEQSAWPSHGSDIECGNAALNEHIVRVLGQISVGGGVLDIDEWKRIERRDLAKTSGRPPRRRHFGDERRGASTGGCDSRRQLRRRPEVRERLGERSCGRRRRVQDARAGDVEAVAREVEGGVEAVRAIVIDDVLGLGAELDAAIAEHLERYEDEWRTTLDDPQKLERFASFINAPRVPDPSFGYVAERGQARPARQDEREAVARGESGVLIAGTMLEVRR